MSNVLTFPLGPLRGVLDGIGDELNELSGTRLTRLSQVHFAGDTVIFVETTFDWPAAGTLYIDGRRYTYTGKTAGPDSFVGIQEIANGVPTAIPGLARDLRYLTSVADGSETFSGVENAKRMLFVGTAEEEFLDVIGRNYGLNRPSGMSDDNYRELIKALAFGPRGTIYAIELLLDILVGPGLYEITEDLVANPNEVFITFDSSITLATTFVGASYFTQREELTSSAVGLVTITDEAADQDRDNIISVTLAPDNGAADFNVLPSADPTTTWNYAGTIAEGTAWTDNTDGTFQNVDAGAGTGHYDRTIRIEPESDFEVEFRIEPLSSGALRALSVIVEDGSRTIGFFATTSVFGFFDDGTGLAIGVPTSIPSGANTFKLRRTGNNVADDADVDLLLNGVVIDTESMASFPATANRTLEFGARDGAAASDCIWHWLRYAVNDSINNYWNARGPEDGSTSSADPDRITSGGSLFTANDNNRLIRLEADPLSAPANTGVYSIVGVDGAGAWVDVTGVLHTATDMAEPLDVVDVDQVRISLTWDTFTANECGSQATLTTGLVGSDNALDWTSRYGGTDGNNIAVQFISAAPVEVQVAVIDPGSGFLEEIEITYNAATHDANDVIAAIQDNPVSDALVNVANTDGSDGTGTPTVLAATNLSGGLDGKFLVISGSTLGTSNDGTYLMSTFIDELNVLVGTHRSPADPQSLSEPSLQPETDLDWRKDPNFATELNQTWEVAASGTLSGAANRDLNLRTDLPFANTDVVVLYSTVLSMQILLNEFIQNPSGNSYYPMYLADPLAFFRGLVDAITAAGVIPRFPTL